MIELGVDDINKVIHVIKEEMGCDFSQYAYPSFKRRIERMIELKTAYSLEDLIAQIASGKMSKEHLLSELTVNVTELFRDPLMWKRLKTLIFEKAQTKEKLRIWHAGCSSGEEVYSVLMILKELDLLDRAEIWASDIDIEIIDKAQKGLLKERSMLANRANFNTYNPEGDLSAFFVQEKEFFQFDPELIDRVCFEVEDITQSEAKRTYDFVFCRNVMIYFNHMLQNKVLELFIKSMDIGSHLIVGSKESIAWCENSTFFQVQIPQEPIFRKTKGFSAVSK